MGTRPSKYATAGILHRTQYVETFLRGSSPSLSLSLSSSRRAYISRIDQRTIRRRNLDGVNDIRKSHDEGITFPSLFAFQLRKSGVGMAGESVCAGENLILIWKTRCIGESSITIG